MVVITVAENPRVLNHIEAALEFLDHSTLLIFTDLIPLLSYYNAILIILVDGDLTLPIYMYDVDTGESINEKMILSLSMESANPELSKVC